MKMRFTEMFAVLAFASPTFAQEALADPDPKDVKTYEWKDFLTDTASGAVTAAGMLGLSGENVTSIENVRSLVVALPSLGSSDSDSALGLSITPARTGFAPMNLSSYASSLPMRLLGSLTLSYARGPSTIEEIDFERSAYAIDTNAFFKPEDDVIVAYAMAFSTCDVLQVAAPDGSPPAEFPPAEPPADAPAVPVNETEDAARQPAVADEATSSAAISRARACKAKIDAKVNGRWNRSQISLSFGEARIRIKDRSKPEESFGRTLAVSVIYGFGNAADGTRGYALTANYRRTEREPVLASLALPETAFKDSSLLVGRLTGGSDAMRIFAEFSNARSRDVTASQRAFKRALGIDFRAFEGTWLNLRIGKQRTIDGMTTETGSLLSLTYSPKAVLQ